MILFRLFLPNEVKENIKNIIEEIIENNPGSKIHVSLEGYRDFIEPKAPRIYYNKLIILLLSI